MKQTLGFLRKADDAFGLIQTGGRIAVGLSGGKDSLLLLYALSLYRRFAHKDYRLCAITVHPGFDFDPGPLHRYCDDLDIPYYVHEGSVVETAIEKIRDGKTPCALCARLRRGALCDQVVSLGYDTLALGHNRNDALETFWMSMFMEGRLNTLSPRARLSRTGITVIRPFLYLKEAHIKGVVKKLGLPVIPSVCPFDGHTMRDEAKAAIASLCKSHPNADEMMFRALRNTRGYNLWDKYASPDKPCSNHSQSPHSHVANPPKNGPVKNGV